MRISSKIAIVLAAVVAAVSVGTVAATWTYSGTEIEPKVDTIDVDLADYKWAGSESLPSGEGSNHLELIQRIIDALNGTLYDEDEEEYITYTDLIKNMDSRFTGNWAWGQYDFYGSMDPDDDLKDLSETLLGGNTDLSFIVKADITLEWNYFFDIPVSVKSYTVNAYYIYTTDVYLGESGESSSGGLGGLYYYNTTPGNPTVPIGEYIYCIYKTELTYNDTTDKWAATSTEAGSAPSSWYYEDRSYTPQATEIPSFDTSDGAWKSTTDNPIGTTIDKAIWTFDTDTPTVYANTTDEKWYYRLVTTGAKEMAFSIAELKNGANASALSTSTETYSYKIDYAWNAAGNYDVATSALNATINIYYGGNDGNSQTPLVRGIRYTPDIDVDIVGNTTTKTQTTSDTIEYYDDSGDLSYYTVTVYTVVTTTTSTDETVEISYTTTTYDSSGGQKDEPKTGTLEELPDMTLTFTAAEKSYYYFEVYGNTEIPLTVDLQGSSH